VREDHPLELPQLRPRLDPQFVDQELPSPAHRLEGVRLAARPVQGDHQLPAQPLAQGVLGHERLQLADQVLAAPAGQPRGEPLLDRLHVKLLQARDLALRELVEAVVGERVASPLGERRLQLGRRGLRIVAA
jgi:hypothetical protein